MIFAKLPTSGDIWMLAVIVLLLVGLIFLSLAEMSLSRITKQKAQALVDQKAKSAKLIFQKQTENNLH